MLLGGISKTNITPPIGMDMTGFLARNNPSIGIHDFLWARALVLADRETKLLIITADLLGFDLEEAKEIRQIITRETGIQNILLSCTHTHSGPAVMTLHGCGEKNPEYQILVKKKIIGLAWDAIQNLIPVEIGYRVGDIAIGLNRRKEWGVSENATIDSELGILRVNDVKGRTLCVLMNYPCHPVVLDQENRLFSRDYPGYAIDYLEMHLNCMALFANGACADINPIRRGGFQEANSLGNMLGGEAVRTLFNIQCERNLPLSAKTIPVNLPINLSQSSNIQGNRDIEKNDKYARAIQKWQDSLKEKPLLPHLEVDIQLFQIGDLVLVGIPGELFVDIGLKMKNKMKPKTGLVFGYTNGDVGYLPTEKAFAEGGYEIKEAFKFYGQAGPFTPEIEEILLTAIPSGGLI